MNTTKTPATPYVLYFRVSTRSQGESELGLPAQKIDAARFVESQGGRILAEFTEIESGKNDSRPELSRALAKATASDATLLVAKLDRLSRNLAFLAKLEERAYRNSLKIKALDVPEFSAITVGILAALAQQERKNISERTRKALAERKASGVQLGNPNLRTKAGRAKSIAFLHARHKEAAKGRNSAALDCLLKKVKSPDDFYTWRAKPSDVMDYLNRRGVTTPRGHRFTPIAASRLMDNHLRPLVIRK